MHLRDYRADTASVTRPWPAGAPTAAMNDDDKVMDEVKHANMQWQVYLRKGLAFLPTVARTDAGFYLNREPVEVVPVTDNAELVQAILRTLRRGNPSVATPTSGSYPKPILLQYAKVKSWSTFASTASGFSIAKRDGLYIICSYRATEGGGHEEDLSRQETLPASTELETVAEWIAERLVSQL